MEVPTKKTKKNLLLIKIAIMRKLFLPLFFALNLIFLGCSNDDNDNPMPGSDNETTNFTVSIENMAAVKAFIGSGVFNTPAGQMDPGAATPGKKYEFTIHAGRKQHLSFVTMLAATNDLFYGPGAEGIALYDENGDPISGDVTDQVYLWDAGTEVNEEPAVGPNTVTNQPGPDTGVVENGNVLRIEDVTNGEAFDYPAVNEVIRVSIMHIDGTEFKVTIEDLPTAHLSTSDGDKPAPVSPGVWVVHNGENPLYTEDMPDLGQGVEHIAEDGNPMDLGNYVADHTGVTYPASPGVWVVHNQGAKALFTEGSDDYGDGIEAIAEDGNPSELGGNLGSLDGFVDGAVFNTPAGESGPGPITPGKSYTFSFDAKPGENLSFATMLAATNDVFFAPADTGIALFDSGGNPISGDVTGMIYLWDAGTEENEQPAVGPNTVTNQLDKNTGVDENQPVRLLSDVNDGYTYPPVDQVLKVTISTN